MPARKFKSNLIALYDQLNRREFVHPDPLEFLYRYEHAPDREIVGFIASSLAYGNVNLILRSVESVLVRMENPREFLLQNDLNDFLELFGDFKYRFTTGEELAYFLFGIKRVVTEYGSLGDCFVSGLKRGDKTVITGLSYIVREISRVFQSRPRSLLPLPERGSACKRLHLFLRWMVRRDEVDPGGWYQVNASKLIVPLDVHMHRVCVCLGLTSSRQANLKTALEITEAFRSIEPDDPVRYDFSLTRLGIRNDMTPEGFLKECHMAYSK